MHPDAMKEMVKEFEKKEALVVSGDLPDDIHIWPRFAYVGHSVVHTYGNFGINVKLRCVKCKTDFNGKEDNSRDCPTCHSINDVYQLNINRSARWRCNKCQYEWDGEIGWECPSCGALENPPRWTCKKCNHSWISEESDPCPNCHENLF